MSRGFRPGATLVGSIYPVRALGSGARRPDPARILRHTDPMSPSSLPEPARAARPVPAILARLRAETRPRHEALERVLDLLDPGLTLARYRAWLVTLRAFHAPMERRIGAVEGWAGLGIDPAERTRLAWLDADLVTLGVAPATAAPDASDEADLPPVRTLSEALGCLYVLEGATLGGRVLLGHLEATLGLGPLNGARTFAGYGTRTGAMWAACRRALERHVADGGDADALVAGANATFASLAGRVEASRR